MNREPKSQAHDDAFVSWGFRRSNLSLIGTSWAAARAYQSGQVVRIVSENRRYYLDPTPYRSGSEFRATLLKLRQNIGRKII